eukprot:COSAG03_NODE_464_length_7697_cov_3.596999_4_plen_46_part_00
MLTEEEWMKIEQREKQRAEEKMQLQASQEATGQCCGPDDGGSVGN